jgi:hypothetical protein
MTYGEMLKTKGREEGRVIDKQDVLIRQLSRKFSLSDAERESIRGTPSGRALRSSATPSTSSVVPMW